MLSEIGTRPIMEMTAAAVMDEVAAAAAEFVAAVNPLVELSATTADATKMERTSMAGMMIHIKKRMTM